MYSIRCTVTIITYIGTAARSFGKVKFKVPVLEYIPKVRLILFFLYLRSWGRSSEGLGFLVTHTCNKLWTKICEIRQNLMRDLTKFCEIFLNITLELPQYSLKSFYSCIKGLVKTTTVCDLCLFLHKIC